MRMNKDDKTKRMMIAVIFVVMVSGCESRAYKSAKEADTVEAYEDFLKEYPNKKYAGEALSRIEALNFSAAKKADTIEAYESFLAKYPKGSFTDKALLRIEELPFKHARKTDTPEAYEQFLQEYPNNKFADEARTRLNKFIRITTKIDSNFEIPGQLFYERERYITSPITAMGYVITSSERAENELIVVIEIRKMCGSYDAGYACPAASNRVNISLKNKGETKKSCHSTQSSKLPEYIEHPGDFQWKVGIERDSSAGLTTINAALDCMPIIISYMYPPSTDEAIRVFSETLKSKNKFVGGYAIRELGKIGVAAIPILIEALKRDDDDIQGSAAVALREIGPEAKDAVPVLRKMLKDEEGFVHSAALGALATISPEVEGNLISPEIFYQFEADKLSLSKDHKSKFLQLLKSSQANDPELNDKAIDANKSLVSAFTAIADKYKISPPDYKRTSTDPEAKKYIANHPEIKKKINSLESDVKKIDEEIKAELERFPLLKLY